jgi:hypothetical protein
MELASMLAGEPFGDHPRSVSPPIGAFLRRYNDLLDDRRRQDLYPYASRVVGTAAAEEVEEKRAELLLSWGDEQWARRRWPLLGRMMRPRQLKRRSGHPEGAGSYAINAIARISDETHAAVLALIDKLIAIGSVPAEPDFRAAEWPSERVTL